MDYKESVIAGWDFTAKSFGANSAAEAGDAFVASVQEELMKLEQELNAESFARKNMGTAQLAGNLAEIFHAGTFNVNAALNESTNRAERLGENGFASDDIRLSSGEAYSSKYIKTAKASADAQKTNVLEYYYKDYLQRAKNNKTKEPDSFEEFCKKRGYDPDDEWILRQSIYRGQGKIIPSDQLEAAKKYLQELCEIEKGKEGQNRQALYQSYLETLNSITDRIRDADGIESVPLSKEEAELLAKMGQDNTIDLSQFGLSIDQLITNEYILKQALKAGYTSAITTLVLQLAPEVYKAIDYLIKNGEIDKAQLKQVGLTALTASAEGFIRGSISSALTISYMAGRLSPFLHGIKESAIPSVIGGVTVIVLETVKDSARVVQGKMTLDQVGERLLRNIMVTFAGVAAGSVMQTLLAGVPTLGYMLGSFVGSAVAGLVFETSEKVLLSICINTGFTFFGLVKQDYSLPADIISEMGLDSFELDSFKPDCLSLDSFELDSFHLDTFEPETIDVIMLERGIVSVRTVGYTY